MKYVDLEQKKKKRSVVPRGAAFALGTVESERL